MKAKTTAIARLIQSVSIYTKNFLGLTVAYFLLIGVFQYLFGVYSKGNLFGSFEGGFQAGFSTDQMIGITLSMIGFMIVSFLIIPVKVATIRGVQQAFLSKSVTPNENFMFGMRNILGIFSTYYYIFLYVAAIPVALLFLGLCMILGSVYFGIGVLMGIGMFLIILSLALGIIFLINRGVKTKFAIYNAVSKEEFTNINFKEAVMLTAYQWWRIVGNFVLFLIVFAIFKAIVLYIAGMLGAEAPMGLWDVVENVMNAYIANPSAGITEEMIRSSAEGLGEMNMGAYIRSFITSILNVFSIVLGIIYFFLLYKVLQDDNGELEIENISGKKMEGLNHEPKRGVINEL